jgi:hypothetical protein
VKRWSLPESDVPLAPAAEVVLEIETKVSFGDEFRERSEMTPAAAPAG